MNLKRTIFAVLAAASLASPAAASGAGVGGITVSPEQATGGAFAPVAFLDTAPRPGVSTLAGRLLIRNLERRRLTVELDAVDAVTASNLGYAYTVSGARARGHTRWIRLSARRLTLAPGQVARVAVRTAPAADAKPADYLSGISVETVGQRRRSNAKKRMTISTSKRYVVGVQMRVPGPRVARLGFGRAAVKRFPAGVTFLLPARNSGNAMLKDVRGKISVYRGGRRIATTRVGPGTLVTGTSARLQLLAARERPSAGTKYRITAKLRYKGGTARYDDEVTFGKRQAQTQDSYGAAPAGTKSGGGGIPLALVIALAIAAIALAVLARCTRRRTRARLARLDELERRLAATADEAGGTTVAGNARSMQATG